MCTKCHERLSGGGLQPLNLMATAAVATIVHMVRGGQAASWIKFIHVAAYSVSFSLWKKYLVYARSIPNSLNN